MSTRYLQRPATLVTQHRRTVCGLYRSLLQLGGVFPDEVAGEYIIWRTRTLFRRRAGETSWAYVKQAATGQRQVQRALRGSHKAYVRILELAYGARGRLKYVLHAHLEQVSRGSRRVPVLPRVVPGTRFRTKLQGYTATSLPPLLHRVLDMQATALALQRHVDGKRVAWLPAKVPATADVPPLLTAFLEERLQGQPRHYRRLYKSLLGFGPRRAAVVTEADDAPTPPLRPWHTAGDPVGAVTGRLRPEPHADDASRTQLPAPPPPLDKPRPVYKWAQHFDWVR